MEPFNTSHSNWTQPFTLEPFIPDLSVFILTLATSDFLFLSITVMQIMETLLDDNWVLGTPMCRLHYFLYAALSVDRCLLVLLPLWYCCHHPLRLSSYICLGAWLVAALLTIKGFVFADVVLYPDRMLVCSSDRGKYEWPLRFLEVLLEGLFPLVVMVTTHVAILSHTVWHHTWPPSNFYHIVAATLSAYVLLNLSFQIVQLLFLVSWEHEEFNNRIFPFMVYFGYLINLNSSINPLIYIFFASLATTRTASLARIPSQPFSELRAEQGGVTLNHLCAPHCGLCTWPLVWVKAAQRLLQSIMHPSPASQSIPYSRDTSAPVSSTEQHKGALRQPRPGPQRLCNGKAVPELAPELSGVKLGLLWGTG
uniref:G-protein coupled receptors family 1 profile domain-containing protein n=1 Tax=Chelonoidis abingdonii TaxID=106734 RepID=A0A8C0H3N4_CHEAB